MINKNGLQTYTKKYTITIRFDIFIVEKIGDKYAE